MKKDVHLMISSLVFSALASQMTLAANETQLDAYQVFGRDSSLGHLSQQPVRVEMINRLELENSHAIDLKDALKYSAGVQMRKLRGKSGEGVWLQGYDSDRVAVLIDGLPVAAGTGSSVDINQIAVGDVERIEISKGAMSAIYGTSAMGGVVNVITRIPEAGQKASLSYSGGSWGSQDEPYDNIPLGKQHLQANYSNASTTGYSQFTLDSQTSNGFRAPNSDKTQGWAGEKLNVSAKNVYRFVDNSQLTLSPRIYREDIHTLTNHMGLISTTDAKVDITEKNYLSALWEKETGSNGKLKINYSFEDYQNKSQQDVLESARLEQQRTTDISHSGFIAQYEFSASYTNKFVFGIEYLNDTMDVTNRKENQNGQGVVTVEEEIEVNDKRVENYNNFFQISQMISPTTEWLLSGRMNNNPKYGFNFSPMMNFQFFPNNLLSGDVSIRLGYGHGYRTPNIKEMFFHFDHSHIGYMIVGNEALRPESSRNLQTSFEWQPNGQTSFDATLYYNRIRNLISPDNEVAALTDEFSASHGSDDFPRITGNQYSNIENAITYGAEWNVQHKFNHFISARLAYAYLYSEDRNTGKTLPKRPEHDAKLGLDFQHTAKLSSSLRYGYLSSQYADSANEKQTPAYTTTDIKLNYQIKPDFKIYGGINNLSGVQQKVFDGNDLRPDEGRYVYFGIKLENLID